jgi:2-C-methyl-D-erythritol 4-phosphate cytidylyltransferase
VVAVGGDPMNFKITTLLDLARAHARMGADGG